MPPAGATASRLPERVLAAIAERALTSKSVLARQMTHPYR
jgi:hypothetical protein